MNFWFYILCFPVTRLNRQIRNSLYTRGGEPLRHRKNSMAKDRIYSNLFKLFHLNCLTKLVLVLKTVSTEKQQQKSH